jgi:hypothetical protein
MCDAAGWDRLVAPATVDGHPGSHDATLAALLGRETREAAIARSPYDITPPTDARPYFFLQLRPWDALAARDRGFVLEITFRAVRLLSLLFLASLGLAISVLVLGLATGRGGQGPAARRRYLVATVYFLGIGFGYILVQLGLHQRLIVELGHPTRALAVVLLSMLWGTGLGSWASSWLFPSRRSFPAAWGAILAVLGAVVSCFRHLGGLGDLSSPWHRDLAGALVVGGVGFVLGFGFPLGLRLVAELPASTVPKLWALNGAASITASAAAALLGLSLGSRWVVAAGLGCYAVVAIAGVLAARASETVTASG